MAAAGVELAFDLTQHAVVGLTDVLKNFFKFLARCSINCWPWPSNAKPDAIIGVDYGGFNLRFGHAVKEHVRNNPRANWNPKIVQFVSPQVWASRPGRAKLLEADYDLLLSIFPFEKDWYAQRAPRLRVEFVGHPMLDRIQRTDAGGQRTDAKTVLLLPGSRKSELQQHLPVLLGALKIIQQKLPSTKAKMVLPDKELKKLAWAAQSGVEIQIGNLPEALAQADVAIASTGTVTMECAFFGVPAVTLYKKPLLGLAIVLGIITVKSFTMPNLMAGEEVYPEFIQDAATAKNISRTALGLLQNESRREKIKSQLAKIVASLGEPGASRRAAAAILNFISHERPTSARWIKIKGLLFLFMGIIAVV